jgi:hypothetical protein
MLYIRVLAGRMGGEDGAGGALENDEQAAEHGVLRRFVSLSGRGWRRAATRNLIIATVLLILLSPAPTLFNRSKRSTGSTVVGPDFASGAEPGRDEPTPVTRS